MRYFIDNNNSYLGGTDGSPLSVNEVPFAPDNARQKWNGVDYDPIEQSIIDAEADIEAEYKLNASPKMRVLFKQIFKLRKINEPALTPADLIAELKADYRAFL